MMLGFLKILAKTITFYAHLFFGVIPVLIVAFFYGIVPLLAPVLCLVGFLFCLAIWNPVAKLHNKLNHKRFWGKL
jgi:hypothetical protein